MDVLAALGILVILVAVVWVISAPLRAGEATVESADAQRLEELEAAKEAKYGEIRDAELDHRTGKLDAEDYRVVDRQLRAEAVAILEEIDRLGGGER